jgi:GntR family transcriptional regulator
MSSLVRRITPLVDQVQEILEKRIKDGYYPADSKLPSESDLAAEFDVSRATLRSALSLLAEKGMVVRRQGAGTFIANIPSIINPMNEAIGFKELIASFGFTPRVEQIHFASSVANASIAERLQIQTGETVFLSHKIFYANEIPVIYCVNTFPSWLLEEGIVEQVKQKTELLEPLYEFLEENCNQRVELHISKVRAAKAGNCEFYNGLPLEPNEPVIVIDSIAYNAEMLPLFLTLEYHHHPDELMTLDLVRRRRT